MDGWMKCELCYFGSRRAILSTLLVGELTHSTMGLSHTSHPHSTEFTTGSSPKYHLKADCSNVFLDPFSAVDGHICPDGIPTLDFPPNIYNCQVLHVA